MHLDSIRSGRAVNSSRPTFATRWRNTRKSSRTPRSRWSERAGCWPTSSADAGRRSMSKDSVSVGKGGRRSGLGARWRRRAPRNADALAVSERVNTGNTGMPTTRWSPTVYRLGAVVALAFCFVAGYVVAGLWSSARDTSSLAQICARVDSMNGLQESLKGPDAVSDEMGVELKA